MDLPAVSDVIAPFARKMTDFSLVHCYRILNFISGYVLIAYLSIYCHNGQVETTSMGVR